MQTSVTYVGHKDFESGRKRKLREGWRVVSVSEVKQPPGAKRILTTGLIGALVVKPKSHFYVTYVKGEQSGVVTYENGEQSGVSDMFSGVRVTAAGPNTELVSTTLFQAQVIRGDQPLAFPAVVLDHADRARCWALIRLLRAAGASAELFESMAAAVPPTAEVPSEPAANSLADEFERLAALHRQGVLTDDEFALAKSRILNTGVD